MSGARVLRSRLVSRLGRLSITRCGQSIHVSSVSRRPCQLALPTQAFRHLSQSTRGHTQQNLEALPPRVANEIHEAASEDLLSLKWSQPPRNVLLVKKDFSVAATEALKEFASHIHETYPEVNILLEAATASEIQTDLPFHIYAPSSINNTNLDFPEKVDVIATFGGDGTILHAASLFSCCPDVPPILSFSMGTLGFLTEWKFSEYKRAFREVYMSGANTSRRAALDSGTTIQNLLSEQTGWSSVRGKAMGPARTAKILVRQRLKVGLFGPDGKRLNGDGNPLNDVHAMNEVIIHRAKNPHLAIVEVFVGGRFLTEAVADGMIVSTPTGSTAYSLSSGGSIVHPLVASLLLTPICPRSLSFRPLVLPATAPITLRLSAKNRGREVQVSIDGSGRSHTVGAGTEVRVEGEEINKNNGVWRGGIPCVMRRARGGAEGDDGWVGGLNGLLKFNYPFGDEG